MVCSKWSAQNDLLKMVCSKWSAQIGWLKMVCSKCSAQISMLQLVCSKRSAQNGLSNIKLKIVFRVLVRCITKTRQTSDWSLSLVRQPWLYFGFHWTSTWFWLPNSTLNPQTFLKRRYKRLLAFHCFTSITFCFKVHCRNLKTFSSVFCPYGYDEAIF